ncbi:MAG: ClpXP protease specificity-enhancing factor SspB [Pseudomonadota bacterium]
MSETINYGRLMHKAMRRLIAEVLEEVAQNGLPGEHHFFISFDTTHPGVDMGSSLKQRYPDEMTIVLQEWFEDLAVTEDRFSVTLSFGGVAEPIVVPLQAVRTFVDPSVEFGLKFDARDEEYDADAGEGKFEEDKEPKSREAEIVSIDQFRKH